MITMSINNKHSAFLNFFLLILLFTIGVLSFTSCNDDTMPVPADGMPLAFSKDTLTFDTIFTTLGSTTEKLLVFNPSRKSIKIPSIKIAGGKSSLFRINVDGKLSEDNSFTDIEIPARDSIYIFVEVTINPVGSNLPVLVADSIIFEFEKYKQRVRLEAYGQNMELFTNKLILNDTTLTGVKPYLIKGYLAIDSAKTLRLNPGTRLYFHNNANFIIYGNLVADGTLELPIELRGDRMDKIKFLDPVPYNYVAGQWGGVYLLWNGGHHVLRHVNITSAYVGLYYINSDRNTLPELEIENCRLHNFVYYGLAVQNGNVKAVNTEISNTGSYTVYLNGGKHEFIHTTIANYYSNNSAAPTNRDRNPALLIMNMNRSAPMETIFRNSIITGTLENEFSIATRFPDLYKGIFTNCYIRRKEPDKRVQFSNIRWYQPRDTVFKQSRYDYEKNLYFDFTPDSVSPARGLADISVAFSYPTDLKGNSRLGDNAPDAGAYEWIQTYR